MWMRYFGQDAAHALIEIVILWLLFFAILKAVRGTRAMQVIQFLVLLTIVTYLCRLLNLSTVYWFLSSMQMPIFVALVILYATELRRTVNDIAQIRLFKKKGDLDDPYMNEISKATQILSRRHIGALIVFERSSNLQGFIDTGINMDSQVSSELLVSLFSPLTPLHDGAVILRNQRVASAACLLPLSERELNDTAYGMRHRAALGLAEETDALVVIVSEESGEISLAVRGNITRGIDPERIHSILVNVLAKGGGT